MYNNALTLQSQGQIHPSLQQCEIILKKFPDFFPALQLVGTIFCEVKDYIQALNYFSKAVKADKKNPGIYSNRGNVYQFLKQYDLAFKDFDKAISLKKNFAEAYYNKANCYKDMNDYSRAIDTYKKALMYNPKMPDVYINMGLCYQNLQQFDVALENYNKSIEIKPNDWLAHNNKGYVLHCLLRLDESREAYNKAISLTDKNADTRFNLGLVNLCDGDWEKGWEGHEIRWSNRFTPIVLPDLWKGEDLTGKNLFIHHEQGLGDTIQFCRYIKLVKNLGVKKIIVAARTESVSLLRSIPEIDVIVNDPKLVNENDYHYQVPFMSLPYIFKTRIDNIPKDVPYLSAPKDKVSYWKDKLKDDKKFKVGLVWSGGFRQDQPELWAVNNRRNIQLDKLAILQNPNITFYSLQKGEPAETELKNSKMWDLVDYTSELKDFADTAALIENLDLIISVDTSTAHVAGALNKPIWLLNRFDTCWRWLIDHNTTDWYPSFKIYRQNTFNNWDNVIEEVKKDLDKKVKL
jgi:Tfp pilus assembly protein PilF